MHPAPGTEYTHKEMNIIDEILPTGAEAGESIENIRREEFDKDRALVVILGGWSSCVAYTPVPVAAPRYRGRNGGGNPWADTDDEDSEDDLSRRQQDSQQENTRMHIEMLSKADVVMEWGERIKPLSQKKENWLGPPLKVVLRKEIKRMQDKEEKKKRDAQSKKNASSITLRSGALIAGTGTAAAAAAAWLLQNEEVGMEVRRRVSEWVTGQSF